jgi:transposase-like protein
MAIKTPLPPTPAELTFDEILARFSTDEQARLYLEAVRWQKGRFCPHCGNANESRIHAISANRSSKVRDGLYDCGECRQQFTVTVGTVFHGAKKGLRIWVAAFYMLCTSKKGLSALQLQRMFKIGSYRTAWLMLHKIRYAMKDAIVIEKMTGTVEADETYVGARRKRGSKRGRPGPDSHKTPVVSLVQRGGKVRSRVMLMVTGENLKAMLREHVEPSATLMTDEFQAYKKPGSEFAEHQTVNHSADEYVRGDAHVNMAEGFFSLLKRGINGVYHHVGRQHLGQYLSEFDFRYNTRSLSDGARTIEGIRKAEGKRMMLRRPKRSA